MKKDKSLRFVLRYYRSEALDIKAAYRKTLAKAAGSGISHTVLHPLRWAVAAVIAALLVGGGIMLFRPTVTTIASAETNRVVRLEDGTVVTLAPHSTLAYRGDCRTVRLTGKAYLDIHHDVRHPFTIRDDNYVIHDIGTRLMVDETVKGRATVYVEEGSVALASDRTEKDAIVLRKDEGATIRDGGRPRRVDMQSQNITAWATGEFHFDNAPLQAVLGDLSHYYNVSLSCADGDDKRLTADFHADSLQAIVGMIEEALNVNINIK